GKSSLKPLFALVEDGTDPFQQPVDPCPGPCRDRANTFRRSAFEARQRYRSYNVDLVRNQHRWYFAGANFVKYRFNYLDLLCKKRIGHVNEMQQQVRAPDLFQRAPEGLDERVRNLVDKADGVHDHHFIAVG